MRKRWLFAVAAATFVVAVGAAGASHVAATVDTSALGNVYFAAHNDVSGIEISSFARVVKDHRADAHLRQFVFAAGSGPTGWHTHPGPAIVLVKSGTFGYQDGHGNECRTRWYSAGQGFFDPGFGHVHRGIPGPSGAHLYTLFLTPTGAAGDTIGAAPPKACSS